ncbi:Density-regulated protein DRP1 [Artemisia annua]|uniref:Density-regulated protein DRP1 n=1 Tax=Artemisia annua TaxID=35608 RepID=A0A2U1LQI7_ARTAN|nr:Density-regulated protein DRP1 [Artemisia annua]
MSTPNTRGVKLSEASKKRGKKFTTGASVVKGPTEKDQIDVQGDIAYGIVEFITHTWPDLGNQSYQGSEQELALRQDAYKTPVVAEIHSSHVAFGTMGYGGNNMFFRATTPASREKNYIERFGITQSTHAEEDEKKNARLSKFGSSSTGDPLEEEKRKQGKTLKKGQFVRVDKKYLNSINVSNSHDYGSTMHDMIQPSLNRRDRGEVKTQMTIFSSEDEEEFDNEAAIVHTVLTDSEVSDCPICPNQLFTPRSSPGGLQGIKS